MAKANATAAIDFQPAVEKCTGKNQHVDTRKSTLIKLKLLFDICSMYGFNVKDDKERVYILHIFELAFPGHVHRRKIYLEMVEWDLK